MSVASTVGKAVYRNIKDKRNGASVEFDKALELAASILNVDPDDNHEASAERLVSLAGCIATLVGDAKDALRQEEALLLEPNSDESTPIGGNGTK